MRKYAQVSRIVVGKYSITVHFDASREAPTNGVQYRILIRTIVPFMLFKRFVCITYCMFINYVNTRRFLVYGSRKARSIPMEVPAEDINDNAHRAIDPDLPTKVIVHGFGSSCDHVWVYEMRSALMTVHECNIGMCIDWKSIKTIAKR